MAVSQVPWKKRILVPFWCVRILFMVVIIGFYAWAISYVRSTQGIKTTSMGVIVLFMLLLIICLLLDILAIVMFAKGTLQPGAFLIFNTIQTAIWAVILVLDIVAIARDGDNRSGLIGSFIVFLSFLGLLIYAIFNFTKDRKNRTRPHGESTIANPASVPLVHAQPQQYGHTDPESMGGPPYKPAYMPSEVELPIVQGEAAEYYSGAPIKSAQGPPSPNPFADPPPYGQRPHHGSYA